MKTRGMTQMSKHVPPPLTGERITEFSRRVVVEELTDTPGALARITAVLSRGDMINRNGNLYPTAVLKASVPEANESASEGGLIGLMDHPDWFEGNKGSPAKTVLKWEKVWMESDELVAEGVILDTSLGRDLFAQHQAKVKIPLSTNALVWGAYKPAKDVGVDWEGGEDDLIFVAERFQLLTTDVVNDPSNVHARIKREARERRARGDHQMEERIAELEAQLEAERVAREEAEQEATTAREALTTAMAKLDTIEREAIVNEALEGKSITESARAAIMAVAKNASTAEEAKNTVVGLADAFSASQGNGNNLIPEGKQNSDDLAAARAEIGVTV